MIRKLHSTFSYTLAALVILMLLPGIGRGQVNIAAGGIYSENFDGIGSTATATIPASWKMENIATVRSVTTAYSLVANTATTYALTYNAAMSSSAGNGRWNFGGTSATDRAIGGISSSSASKSVNMFLQLTNNGASTINDFTISYDAERYRNGTNAAGFSIRFYYSNTGADASWIEVPDFIASFTGANADNNGSVTNPIQTINVLNKTLSQSLAAGVSIYLAWSYSVTSGTTTSNAQALGIDNISITANGAAVPTITATGTFNPFTTTVGTPSASQSIAVSGSNLTSTIEVSAVTGYEYSTDNSTWSSTLSLASSFNGNVYVRLTGASIGSPAGTISFSSTGAATVDKSVTGIVNPLSPVINVTGTFSPFSTTTGTPSASQSVSISGSNLTASIDVSAVTGFEYSTDNAIWTTTLSLASSYNGNVYVRLTGASLGSPSGTISFTSTGATQVDKAVSGSVTAPPPVITVTGTFSTFAATVGTPSASQSVAVSGANLTSAIEVTALSGYEYSTTDADPWTSSLSLSSSFSGNIYVRLTGASGGAYSGNVSFTSTGAPQVDKTVTGTVTCAAAALPLYEDFNYAVNSFLTSNCWEAHSGAGTSPIAVGASNGLTYSGYSGLTGIMGVAEGNAAKIVANGEDDSKIFNAVSAGPVYFSFLVNVATGTSGYFLNLGKDASSFAARVFVKPSGSDINFGLSNTSTGVYASTPTAYAVGTTYLIIVKYDISTSDVNMWVKESGIPINESVLGTPEVSTTGSGQTSIARICLRQYSTTQSIVVDDIRLGTTFSDIFPAGPTETIYTGTGNWSTSGNWSNGIPTSANDAIIDGNVTIDVTAETKDLTINTGKSVTVSDTKSLTVTGTLTNTAGTSGLVVNSGGSLITNNSVLATVKRDYSGGTNFHYFCLPVSGTSIATTPTFNGAWLDEYVESSGEWNRLGDADNVVSGKGYSINFEAANTPLSFSGSIYSTDQIAGSLTYTNAAPGYGPGWHLLGNPFTAALDLNSSSWVMDHVDAYAYVWDGSNYLVGPTVPADANGYTYGTLPGNLVPAMQGFFVHVTADNAALTIPAAARTYSTQAFYKSAGVTKDALFLSINGNGYQDKAIVAFNPSATANFDGQYDAYKLFGIAAAPQLYSIIPGEKAAVNTLPDYISNPNISLGLKVGAATTYTLNASGMDSFDASLPINLYDLKTGATQDLRLNPVYSFTAAPGDAENRFTLSFASVTGLDKPGRSGINMTSANGTIRITHDAAASGTVYLYSVSGQLLATSKLNAGETRLHTNSNGVFMVKVVTGKSTYTQKLVVVQ